MPRTYSNIKLLEPEILAKKSAGITMNEIAKEYGLSWKQIRNLVYRHNVRQREEEAGIMVHPKGRPRKDGAKRDVNAEKEYEIRRLKMENELLRDFLRAAGRK